MIGAVAILVGACTSGTVTTGVPATSTFPPADVDPAPLIADFCGRSSDVIQQLHADLEMEASQIEAAVHHDAAAFRDAAGPQASELRAARLEVAGRAGRVANTAYDLASFRGAGGLDELRRRVRVLSSSVAAFEKKYC